MNRETWERVQSIFEEVRSADLERRPSLIAVRCGTDGALREEVESLLAASEAATRFFDDLADRAVPAAPGAVALPEWMAPGERAGGFLVRDKLGSGGMGHVYRATDTRLGRDVALKVLAEHLGDDPTHADRFRREARMLAALNHPSIAAIYGMEEVERGTVLVLELVEGQTLAERLAHGRMAMDEAVDVARQIADALAVAHRANIAHRDLKPANVKLTPDGRVKILDFGIARSVDDGPVGAGAAEDDRGMVMGTIPYMSPEQLEGGAADVRTDVWAFGVVLFEMLAGRRPFGGGSRARALADIATRTLPWEALPSDTPSGVVALLERCLEPALDRRLGDVAEAARILERARDAATGATVDPRRGGPSQEAQSTATRRRLEQDIRFCQASDGVRIAYATVGEGPVLVKAANWLNHLEYDWDSPVWRNVFRELAADYTLVRYDERGNGLSDRDVAELSFEAFVRDLETVVEAAGLDRFALFGISQGASVSVAYAVRHPERVTHLVLLGGYAQGRGLRSPEAAEQAAAMRTLMRLGWGQDNAQFRQLFTSSMIPGATPEQMRWFNDLQRMTASAETAVRLREAFDAIDVGHLLPQVRVPTFVAHARGDATVPFEQGRRLASEIPGARFCTLESQNHLLLDDEPAWPRFFSEMKRFLAT